MATISVPPGFVSIVIRTATLGFIPIALIFYRLAGKSSSGPPGASSSSSSSSSIWPLFSILALAGLAWQVIVSLWVPDPYLDEIFHIPQAQKYCDGHWSAWDDKITTPPGLYIFSVTTHRLWWLLTGHCSPLTLRMTNWLTILTLAIVASQCRRLVEARLAERENAAAPSQQQPPKQQPMLSDYALHTGMNIAFFPLLFFFSALYYTDLLSTLVVLVAFGNTLMRIENHKAHSWQSNGIVVLLGVASLFMRQTNIFWVVIFMGGLEAVHAAGALRPPPTRPGEFDRQTKIKYYLSKYSQGEIHDPPLDAASLDDVFYCALSIAIAVVCNPLRVTRQIWAHVLVMVLFVGFVFWNGGVVLGDKSNHVATIHLPQMLYIWPLFAFFSAPLLLPTIFQPIESIFFSSPASSLSSRPSTSTATSLFSKSLNILGYALLLPLALAIIKFNTIIHPFTLADNRHYMFYVFRYSILQAGWVRYALAPIYVFSGILCMKTLGGASFSTLPSQPPPPPPPPQQVASTKKKSSSAPLPSSTMGATATSRPPTLSTTLLFGLTTTLSLMTAPLVEPRYFILPWVFWRLLLPSLPEYSSLPGPISKFCVQKLPGGVLGVEMIWFILINLVTMYIFIAKPFTWPSEEGWQRFMW